MDSFDAELGHTARALEAQCVSLDRSFFNSLLEFPVDWIEHQLAHAVKDANGRAYNRTKHLEQRRGMMQAWADYLEGLKKNW